MATITKFPRGNVAGVLLAAGLSTRMGTLKQLLPVEGEPMVARVARTLVAAGLADIIAVVGHERRAVEQALQPLPIRTMFNPDYRHGEMFSSVQIGLRALPPNTDAALIALSDQPFVSPQTIRALIAAYAGGSASILQPQFGDRLGHPILLHHTVWPDVLTAPPGTTLREIVRQHDAERRFVPVDDPGILVDLDRPEDAVSSHIPLRASHIKHPVSH